MQVKIAIGIIREASKSLQAIPMLIVWPFFPFFLAMLLFGYFCGIAGYVYSSGSITLEDVRAAAGVSNETDIVLSSVTFSMKKCVRS